MIGRRSGCGRRLKHITCHTRTEDNARILRRAVNSDERRLLSAGDIKRNRWCDDGRPVGIARRRRDMEIKRAGSQPSGKGPSEYFTGAVRLDPLFTAPTPARVAGVNVTFEPGARTAWHTHPLGQTLIVTAGCGRAQRWGGPIEDIRPGDVIWFPPGEKHWHGASPTTAMTHIAIQENLDGKVVEWLEKVADDQYRR